MIAYERMGSLPNIQRNSNQNNGTLFLDNEVNKIIKVLTTYAGGETSSTLKNVCLYLSESFQSFTILLSSTGPDKPSYRKRCVHGDAHQHGNIKNSSSVHYESIAILKQKKNFPDFHPFTPCFPRRRLAQGREDKGHGPAHTSHNCSWFFLHRVSAMPGAGLHLRLVSSHKQPEVSRAPTLFLG